MRPQNDTPPDLAVASIAAEQHGQVSTRQLLACGLESKGITRRVRAGRLHRVHRGVYAVGHPALTLHARFSAAVLACGVDCALSHVSAAALWGFLAWEDRAPEVTVVGSSTRAIAGVRIHRARTFDERDVLRRHAIRVTSPARTLLDLAVVLRPHALRTAARRAQAEKRVNVRQLAEILARGNGHHGVGALRAIVADGPAPTRSELEDILLDLLDGANIERPELNAPLIVDRRRIVPDCLWRDRRLVIEADGRIWHDDPLTRRNDADKQAMLEAHGYRVMRVTWRQIAEQPQQTLARVSRALGAQRQRA